MLKVLNCEKGIFSKVSIIRPGCSTDTPVGMWMWGRVLQVLAATLTLSQPSVHLILVSTPSFESHRRACSRLLEFEKKYSSTGCLIETFSKYPDQVV